MCLDVVLARERASGAPARTLDSAMTLLRPVAEALAISHARGASHLDVRPGTLFVLCDPRAGGCVAKLLAAATSIDDLSSAAPYRAPEQRCGAYGITGPWTDVFALARVLVELVGGRAGARADAVLARALATYPVERYQTAESFWPALERVRTPTTTLAPHPLWRARPPASSGTLVAAPVAAPMARSPR